MASGDKLTLGKVGATAPRDSNAARSHDLDLEAFESRWRHRPPDQVRDRFEHVSPPPDPGTLARRAVARLRELLGAPGAANAEVLNPFLDGVDALVEQAWPVEPTSASQPEPDPPDDPTEEDIWDSDDDDVPLPPTEAARALVAEVEQLEDLMEALRAVRHR